VSKPAARATKAPAEADEEAAAKPARKRKTA